MKKIPLLMVLLLSVLAFSEAQALSASDTIVRIEYFVDVDPGFGLATNIPISQDTLIEIDFTALLAGASPGIHIIGIRAMNGESQWGQTHIFRFLKDNKTTVDLLPDLSQAEYFVDTDNGYGSGTPITISEDSIVQLNPVINLSTVSEGFHILGVRAKDGDVWGQTHLFRFMMDNKTTVDLLPDIIELEYFIDTDAGFGQSAPLTITPDSLLHLNPAMNLTSLQPGYHILGVRAKDAKAWGQTHLFRFMLDNKTTVDLLPTLTQVEYFIDTDPGYGNSTSISMTPDSMIHMNPTISMNGLSAGFHILGIRSKDQQTWGQTHLYRFLNNDEPPTLHNLSYIEYFIDTDPDFGNATKVYPAQDSLWDTTFVADISTLALGSYFMGVRAMDTMNKFSHTYIHPFTVVVPPTAYNFTGGGSLCAGSGGLSASLTDSDIGVSYILFKDGANQDTLPGTDTNLVWNNLTAGIYTVTGYYTTTPHIFAPMNGTVTVTEYPLPIVVCPSDFDVCISVDSLALLGATPVGGTYSGVGVSNGYFYPAQLTADDYDITYVYQDINGCIDSCSFTVSVNDLPLVNCPVDFDICISVDSVLLNGGLPANGTYSGTGVVNNYFKPSVAGLGNHAITYTITDGNLCSNTCNFTITVNMLPVVSCIADFAVCSDLDSLLLSGASPAGGTYSGTGVSNGYFYPAQLSPGFYDITYTYQDFYNCANSCVFTITVSPQQITICPVDFALCLDADSVLLTGGLPLGGTYSGTGVNGDYFNPSIALPGNHIISYTFTNVNSCSSTCTFTVTVHDVPVLNCGPDLDVCINADTFMLISSMLPPGGTYSGTGVNNNYFNPAVAGIGSHTIMYEYTDTNSCLVFCTFDINVHGLPQITVNANSPVCQGETITLTASGGTTYSWSGPGGFTNSTPTVTINNADIINAGSYAVTVSNAYSCSADTTVTIAVNTLPTVSINASQTSVCNGQSSILTATGSANISDFLWNTNATTAQITVTPTLASSAYSVTVTTIENCSNTAGISIIVNNNPAVSIDGVPETCQDKGDGAITVTIITTTVQPYTYLWHLNSIPLDSGNTSGTSFILQNCEAGDYTLLLTDAFNCSANETYTLAPAASPCNQGAMVPDIFSPNGDNINDVLYVYGKNIKDIVFVIYSRFGNKLFESTDMGIGWDGKYNGVEMPSGVYAYYLIVTFNDGSADIKHGDVTLVR